MYNYDKSGSQRSGIFLHFAFTLSPAVRVQRLSPLANLIRTEEKDRDNSGTHCKLGIIDIP
jgi:hypothetical protein